jgi:hypothetical protein
MSAGDVETYFDAQVWFNRIIGQNDPIDRFESKDEAIAAGRDESIERGVEHIIRTRDGQIYERNSYGNDTGHSSE